jgi:hypothetical protein
MTVGSKPDRRLRGCLYVTCYDRFAGLHTGLDINDNDAGIPGI